MNDRSLLIEWVRGEIVGPSRTLSSSTVVEFNGKEFSDAVVLRSGPIAWKPTPEGDSQEVLYFERETPHRKYGAGVLHPGPQAFTAPQPDEVAAQAFDNVGVDVEAQSSDEESEEPVESNAREDRADLADASDDFEISSPDVRRPSTMGISFCVSLNPDSAITIRVPQSRLFAWQTNDGLPFLVNGRYERCSRKWIDSDGQPKEAPAWRRQHGVVSDAKFKVYGNELVPGRTLSHDLEMPSSLLRLQIQLFPRRVQGTEDIWLITVVLRNVSQVSQLTDPHEVALYQTYFEVSTTGQFESYPESHRPFSQLDSEEQSLSLLYRESCTWAIGHGCAAGWDTGPNEIPAVLFADVMPAVQTPSMTPDITDANGNRIELSMRSLAELPDDLQSGAWPSLDGLVSEYETWISARRAEIPLLPSQLRPVAERHLTSASSCKVRIEYGIKLLRDDPRTRSAFRLANLAMLLQQIATKQLARRPLRFTASRNTISPDGAYVSPWDVYNSATEFKELGKWRAFQIAFLLMSIRGVSDEFALDREIVDLIWFPTGGGKTEAYLAVIAFYMFHQRFLAPHETLRRDGTNVLMRYTLRMLTTQQFQRAASLICSMEHIRRNAHLYQIPCVPGIRFSLGLWIGSSASANKISQARTEIAAFRAGKIPGNPLILTECPWCRGEIGRYAGPKPKGTTQQQWQNQCVRGISDHPTEGPLLLCPDPRCAFGVENSAEWLPIEVIDQRIYDNPPSMVIATADKLAIVAYRPTAGALFGRTRVGDVIEQTHLPPGIIVQDELHLISGPLGTVYGLYEGIFERLCSFKLAEKWVKPKLIASTATIRGAADQVKSLYARSQTQLFPAPGLLMGDSFFGLYARDETHKLRPGRLYLGIHASDYGSVLTAQVRAFSSVLFRPQMYAAGGRDPWWTLLVFYNSLRELGGAKTLFDSDIRSRLKFIFTREGVPLGGRRNLKFVEELTSRLSQSEIVEMMDRLATRYAEPDNKSYDVCLASNIIEVGVDIDRLSLMGVVGQPKTTAQYIQVTGRVGRRWWERPGLILTIYNPSKSRDRSHFEQFYSYHWRLYERVEPTSATPFALSAIQRALPGALLVWARQHCTGNVQDYTSYEAFIDQGHNLLKERCIQVQVQEDQARSLAELERVRQEIAFKWSQRPMAWEEFPPSVDGEYLMLWPGQFATIVQKRKGLSVPTSMRQVDGTAELTITQGYEEQ
jgi:hypothetical protein